MGRTRTKTLMLDELPSPYIIIIIIILNNYLIIFNLLNVAFQILHDLNNVLSVIYIIRPFIPGYDLFYFTISIIIITNTMSK